MIRAAFLRPFALVVLFAGLAVSALSAAPMNIGGAYEGQGMAVMTEPAYEGPVSMRALLSLDFDYPRGLRAHGGVTRVEFVQEERSLKIITRDADGRQEWTAEWNRNGGFQATAEGVKFLIRTKPTGGQLYMFTLNPASEGAAMTVKIQRVENTTRGPIGYDVGTFLFLRADD